MVTRSCHKRYCLVLGILACPFLCKKGKAEALPMLYCGHMHRSRGFGLPLLIGIVAIITIVVGGSYYYAEMRWPTRETKPMGCTLEAKICPDGSAVGRTGPNCAFAACPEAAAETPKKATSTGAVSTSGPLSEAEQAALFKRTATTPSEPKKAATPSKNSTYSGKVLAGSRDASPLLEFTLSDYRKVQQSGLVVILFFYSDWSPISRAEFIEMQSAFNGLSGGAIGFRVNYVDSAMDADEKELAYSFQVTHEAAKVILKGDAVLLKTTKQWMAKDFVTEIKARR